MKFFRGKGGKVVIAALGIVVSISVIAPLLTGFAV